MLRGQSSCPWKAPLTQPPQSLSTHRCTSQPEAQQWVGCGPPNQARKSYPFSSRRGAAAGLWGVESRGRPPAGDGGAHFPPVLPPQVTPLTALKFAELTLKAGIPKGVINVLPGSGKGRGRGHEVHLVKTGPAMWRALVGGAVVGRPAWRRRTLPCGRGELYVEGFSVQMPPQMFSIFCTCVCALE